MKIFYEWYIYSVGICCDHIIILKLFIFFIMIKDSSFTACNNVSFMIVTSKAHLFCFIGLLVISWTDSSKSETLALYIRTFLLLYSHSFNHVHVFALFSTLSLFSNQLLFLPRGDDLYLFSHHNFLAWSAISL